MLRDRIVCGINNSTIQNRLLAEPKLDFKKAMSLAQGLELAAQNAKELKSSGIPQEAVVHKVTSLGKADGVVCHRCGEKGHKAPTCRFKNATCHKCGKIGHIKKVCRSKGKKGPPGRKYPSRPVHRLEEDQWGKAEEYQLFHYSADNRSPPAKVEVVIDEQPLCMELDTGVAPSIVSEATFKELWPNCVLTPSEVRLRMYSGEAIPVVGSANVCVKYKQLSCPCWSCRAQVPVSLDEIGFVSCSWTGSRFISCEPVPWMQYWTGMQLSSRMSSEHFKGTKLKY